MTAPVQHNIFQVVVPLPEIWQLYLLPYLAGAPPPDLAVVARARLRLVSRAHRDWDPTFVTPAKWAKVWQRLGRAPEAKRVVQGLAFIGWELLPPSWADVEFKLNFDNPLAGARITAISRALKATCAPLTTLMIAGDFGDRHFSDFTIGFWATYDFPSTGTIGVHVSVQAPHPDEPDTTYHESVRYETPTSEREALIALRRFLRAMPEHFSKTGTCDLGELDAALMLAYRRPLPRRGIPLFEWEHDWGDGDDDDDVDSGSDDEGSDDASSGSSVEGDSDDDEDGPPDPLRNAHS